MNWDKPVCQYPNHRDADEVVKEKVEFLNWVIRCLSDGYTRQSIQVIIHNKIVELTGEGEKA